MLLHTQCNCGSEKPYVLSLMLVTLTGLREAINLFGSDTLELYFHTENDSDCVQLATFRRMADTVHTLLFLTSSIHLCYINA